MNLVRIERVGWRYQWAHLRVLRMRYSLRATHSFARCGRIISATCQAMVRGNRHEGSYGTSRSGNRFHQARYS